MKHFLVTVAGVFSGLLLFFIGLPLVFVVIVASATKPPPPIENAVLALDLRQSLPDQDPNNPLAFLGATSMSTLSVARTVEHAAGDPGVKGLLIRLPEGGMAPAEADELRIALKTFVKAGKPVIAHSQGLYASGISTATYMLGAASGDFWMQPGAPLQSTGISREDTFLKRFFDKYGLKADYQQRYQYKNAVNGLLYDDYTPAHREAELGWMTSVYNSELAAAAADRKMDPQTLKTAIQAGPYGAEEAQSKGLIDHIGEVEAAQSALLAKAGPNARLLDFQQYRSSHKPQALPAGASVIAYIGAEGDIVTGTGADQGFGGSNNIYSDDVAKAFYAAIHDDQVKAIVFRVSSPGGGDTASEQIHAAVQSAKAAHKPVVVSMGTYAASGGYWISSPASEIIAEPTTLTGSIGVFGGKLVVGPALAKFGIDQRDLSVGGDFAGANSSAAEYTPAQRAAVSTSMDRTYATFVDSVAQGRAMPLDKVQAIARGRVWTGEQAVKLGLVDKLGGFDLAVLEAKRLAGIPADEHVILKTISPKRSPLDILSHAIGMGSVSLKTLGLAIQALSDPRMEAALADLDRLRLQAHGGATVLAPQPTF
jgi:protease-4